MIVKQHNQALNNKSRFPFICVSNSSFPPMDSTNSYVHFCFDVLHPRLFCFVINATDTCNYAMNETHAFLCNIQSCLTFSFEVNQNKNSTVHYCLFSPWWPLAFLIFSLPLYCHKLFLFKQHWSPLFFISCSSSFPVIQVNV